LERRRLVTKIEAGHLSIAVTAQTLCLEQCVGALLNGFGLAVYEGRKAGQQQEESKTTERVVHRSLEGGRKAADS
jgi:hypothetical protein